MLRTALAVLLVLTAPATAQVTGSLGPNAPVLKRSVTVTGDVVRIGDLIDNAGTAAQIAVFRAPDLGTTGMVSTFQIMQAVRAHAVLGVDTAGVTEVQVTRAGRAITSKDVEGVIAQAVARQLRSSSADEIAVRLDREMRTLHVEPGNNAPLHLARFNFDPKSSNFYAILEVPGATGVSRLRFGGKAMETVEVAVPTRPLARGEVVRTSDVVMERRPKSEFAGETMGEADRAVGMALRRAARAGQPLRAADLMRPELVQRNENITLIFEAPGIMLTSRAKALETGAEGDVISVLNVQSKRTVQGTVTGPATVTVTSMKPRVAAVASNDPASPQESRSE